MAFPNLPEPRSGAAGIEEAVFFGAWTLFAGAALLILSAAASARLLTVLAALGCLGVPVANGLATGAWPWVSAALDHRVVLAIDLAFLAAGITLCWAAWRVLPVLRTRWEQ